MSTEPRVLRHGTDTPDVAVIPFRWACGQGHLYVARGGTPDPKVLADFMRGHEQHEDGQPTGGMA